jgi:hypothetical protein
MKKKTKFKNGDSSRANVGADLQVMEVTIETENVFNFDVIVELTIETGNVFYLNFIFG